ncbi:MAG: hypothetical protein A3F12_05405 [Gammaproteobacteria bacterium RIFCSPHIGHO2_12_FULL_38_14]|nr:MAG: hypothetical protein A3F12_05405 [Gammaproteobacteria bacterium RIFCSPHIGHO2_12_FULL_38_14]
METLAKQQLVFIPGLGFDAAIFGNLFLNHQQFFYDLPKNFENESSLIEQINGDLPQESTLIAWSLGGLIAISLCFFYPEKYKSLILIASTPHFNNDAIGIPAPLLKQFQAMAATDFSLLLKKLNALVTFPHRQFHHQIKKFLWMENKQASFLAYLNLLTSIDLRKQYEKLSLPILQIFGEQDAILPLNAATLLAKTKLTKIIPQASHAPFLTHPTIWHDHVISFLADQHD